MWKCMDKPPKSCRPKTKKGEVTHTKGRRVPYKQIDEGKVQAVGLPEGVSLKRPGCYGKVAMEAILAKEKDLLFLVATPESAVEHVEESQPEVSVMAAPESQEIGLASQQASNNMTSGLEDTDSEDTGDDKQKTNKDVKSTVPGQSSRKTAKGHDVDGRCEKSGKRKLKKSVKDGDVSVPCGQKKVKGSNKAGAKANNGLETFGTSKESSTEQPTYIIQKIIGMRNVSGTFEYRVKWRGYAASHNSWEPESGLPTESIRKFLQKQ